MFDRPGHISKISARHWNYTLLLSQRQTWTKCYINNMYNIERNQKLVEEEEKRKVCPEGA